MYDVTLEKNHTLLIAHEGTITWGSNCRGMLTPLDDEEAQVEDNGISDLVAQLLGDTAEEGLETADLQTSATEWTPEAVTQLDWDKFDVTDPDVFQEVDDAIEAGTTTRRKA